MERGNGVFRRPALRKVLWLAALAFLWGPVGWAQDLTVNVSVVGGGAPAGFHWTLEEDATFDVSPGVSDPNPLTINFHRSYMPLVAQGKATGSSATLTGLDPEKRYFLTVLASEQGYTLEGVAIAKNQVAASVALRPLPLPTAQVTIHAFEDIAPLNNNYDIGERGLAGWEVVLADAGGRYGMSGGHQTMDIFGNMLGTEYALIDPAHPELGYQMVDGAPVVTMQGKGLVTGPDGTVIIKNLARGKYTIFLTPPPGQEWYQTTTIEGTKGIDAWVKANEPTLMIEFGIATTHIFMGFLQPFVDTAKLNGSATVVGQVQNFHMARPPNVTDGMGASPFPSALVGLNDSQGNALCAIPANPETGEFAISNVPPGSYQLVMWDKNLDMIIAFATAVVAEGQTTVDMGQIAVNDWFAHLWNYVFYDADQDGFPDPGEGGIPDQNINIRFRDGSVYQAMPTDVNGWAPLDEVFPFFDWLVAEVDFLRFKATGVTVVTDAGGFVDTANEDFPGYGRLNPQLQPENGGAPYRTEVGPTLTQGVQVFAGQTNVLMWGKSAYTPPENGGISGVVFYDVTRAENDPRYNGGEPWQPGIPRVPVCLYQDTNADGVIDDVDGTAGIQLCDVDYYPFGWADGGAMGPEDVKRNGTGTVFTLGDALQEVHTDSWDDAQPTGCVGMDPNDPMFDVFPGLDPTDCFDGMRVWNQTRPAVFDGGYAFGDVAPGVYVVEAIPPAGYEVVKEEDKNVDFGDSYVPSTLLLPPVCVGDGHLVPGAMSLFPDEVPAFAGDTRPLCDRKQVRLSGGQNAAADFFLFTQAPISAHYTGIINNDLANQFDPAAPNYGEKPGAAFIPVAMRDFMGKEVTRVYSDAYGIYNGLVPSTFTANVPNPSGFSPAMYSVCINDYGPIPDGQGGFMTDPYARREFAEVCYTFQFMPGTTTYLDTPVVPISAFASMPAFPLDCEQPDLTPVIRRVTGTVAGPYVPDTGGLQTITILPVGDLVVPNPAYDGTNAKTITRHYGFGGTAGTVTLDGTPLNILSWTDAEITAEVNTASMSTGQLLVTTDSGIASPYGVTLHVGTPSGNAPIVVSTTIQAAVDSAGAGDLVIVPPGLYDEMVVLYKDVILQGAGAYDSVILARKNPQEKIDLWRAKVRAIAATGDYLLPGQSGTGNPLLSQGPFASEQGPGVLVLNQPTTPFANARVDGLNIMGADSAGAIFVNAYASNVAISNNYLTANSGSLAGGIRVGNVPNLALGGGEEIDSMNDNVTIRYNVVAGNGNLSVGGGGAGGIGLYTGSDNYVVSDNYVCGNFTQGSGGGIGQIGFSVDGVIQNNKVLFNQNFHDVPGGGEGGGIAVVGIPAPPGLTRGTGTTTIQGNLVQGNYSGVGDGGGIRLAFVNGRDVADNPGTPAAWNSVTVDHNVIINNVSAKGGAVSLQDAANVTITNNTIAQNDSTSTAGELILFTPWPNPGDAPTKHSIPLPAGILSRSHSPAFDAVIEGASFSDPVIDSNILWRNRSFGYDITIDYPYGGLYPPFDPLHPEAFTGVTNGFGTFGGYWDLGVIPGPGTLNPVNGILTDTTGYDGSNTSTDPGFTNAYFNRDAARRLFGELLSPFVTAVTPDEGGNNIQIAYEPLSPTGNYTDSVPGIGALGGGTSGTGETGGTGGDTGGTGGGGTTPTPTPAAEEKSGSGGCFLNTLFGE